MFQSAPRVKTRGDQDAAASRAENVNVSIRAAREDARRPTITPELATPCLFQSAPRVKTRGDATASSASAGCMVFQSAPRVKTRGDCAFFN